MEKEEFENAARVLTKVKEALIEKDAIKLKELSNQTIHSAAFYQNAGSITSAVIIYAISKLIERQDYQKVKNWNNFIKKFNSTIELAIDALHKFNQEAYAKHMLRARKVVESISNLKPYIKDVMRKAAINKGGKLYEHGLSLEKTAQLLGITQWELAEYIAQRTQQELNIDNTLDIKKRAKLALEFFT